MRAFPRNLIVGLALVAVVVGLAYGGRHAQAAGATVTVANFSFTDGGSGTSVTTIQVGDTVTWTWASTGGVPHSTTSTSVPAGASTWDSSAHASPFSYGPVTFSMPGTYTYHCIVHPAQMTGTIIVQAASTPTPVATNTTQPAPSNTVPVVAATSTPAPASTDTPMPTATPGAGVPTSSPAAATVTPGGPVLIAPLPATPAAGVAGASGGALPRAGTGARTSGGRPTGLLLAMLGLAGLAIVAGGVTMRRRHIR